MVKFGHLKLCFVDASWFDAKSVNIYELTDKHLSTFATKVNQKVLSFFLWSWYSIFHGAAISREILLVFAVFWGGWIKNIISAWTVFLAKKNAILCNAIQSRWKKIWNFYKDSFFSYFGEKKEVFVFLLFFIWWNVGAQRNV